jgi:2-iminoacetate synthase
MELERKLDYLNNILMQSKRFTDMKLLSPLPVDDISKISGMVSVVSNMIDKSLNNIFPLKEVFYLLNNKNNLDTSKLVSLASDINFKIHGKNIEFYAVSYISDFCVNKCTYCGHSSDTVSQRRILNDNEMLLDFKEALKLGPSEICILAGEHNLVNPNKLSSAINIAKIADTHNGLDRVILNVAPMTLKQFKELRNQADANIQFRIFQESYDKITYEKNHPFGPKKDFSLDFIRKSVHWMQKLMMWGLARCLV